MQTLPEVGIQQMQLMLTISIPYLDMSFDMLVVQFIGKANSKRRLRYPQLKQNASHYLRLWGRCFLWHSWWRKSMLYFCSIFLSQNVWSKWGKTISLALQWLKIPNSLLKRNILHSSIIIFASMLLPNQIQMDSSALSIAPQMNRLLTYLPNLFRMIFSSS